jgi:hypothetical protein
MMPSSARWHADCTRTSSRCGCGCLHGRGSRVCMCSPTLQRVMLCVLSVANDTLRPAHATSTCGNVLWLTSALSMLPPHACSPAPCTRPHTTAARYVASMHHAYIRPMHNPLIASAHTHASITTLNIATQNNHDYFICMMPAESRETRATSGDQGIARRAVQSSSCMHRGPTCAHATHARNDVMSDTHTPTRVHATNHNMASSRKVDSR